MNGVDEVAIESAILAQLNRGPESSIRVVDHVARELAVAPDLVVRVAGRLTREARLRIHAGGACETWSLWSSTGGPYAAAADDATIGTAIEAAIGNVASTLGASRERVAGIAAQVASRLISRGGS